MGDSFVNQNNNPIIVELSPARGEVDVAISFEDLKEKSVKAIDNAMDTMKAMSSRVTHALQDIPTIDQPDCVELKFGIKLTSETNAIVVNAGVEGQLAVKLIWERNMNSKE